MPEDRFFERADARRPVFSHPTTDSDKGVLLAFGQNGLPLSVTRLFQSDE